MGMNGSEGIVSGNLCFAPLDDVGLDEPLVGLAVTVPQKYPASLVVQDPADRLEQMLNDFGVRGAAVNAADLDETPDDRGGYALVVCRIREPIAA